MEIHVQKFSQRDVTKKNLSKPQQHDNAKIYSVRALSFGVEDISMLIKYIWITKTKRKRNIWFKLPCVLNTLPDDRPLIYIIFKCYSLLSKWITDVTWNRLLITRLTPQFQLLLLPVFSSCLELLGQLVSLSLGEGDIWKLYEGNCMFCLWSIFKVWDYNI